LSGLEDISARKRFVLVTEHLFSSLRLKNLNTISHWHKNK